MTHPTEDSYIAQSIAALGIPSLNEMQTATVAAASAEGDLVLLSPTGSGKTLAFLLPVLQGMKKEEKGSQAIIIAPSRELALQIEEVWRRMGTGYKVTCCYGGHKREIEEQSLVEAPALLIGTPGRLADHIRRGNITLDSIRTAVLDEFDKSLESGFEEEVGAILEALPSLKRRILTSATELVESPDWLSLSSARYLHFLPEEITTGSLGLAVQQVSSPDKDKLETLFRLLCHLGGRSSIVFCNHREAVERTAQFLQSHGLAAGFYHGAMEQREREAALAKFRNGTYAILVTTDLASRGLDVPNIRYIIHYHLPHTEEIFTHRNGRTARMDASGTAILVIGPDEKKPAYAPEEMQKTELPEETEIPEKPKWATLFVGAGKKDKINKIDIVGFLSKIGDLKKEDIGLIEVKDFFAFVAIRKSRMSHLLHLIKDQKIKGKNIKMDIAR